MPGIGEFAQRLSIRIDGPTGIEHHRRLESCLSRIKGRRTHTKVKRKTANIHFAHFSFGKPPCQAGFRFSISFDKGRIAVAVFTHAFAHNERRTRKVKRIGKLRTVRARNAVHGPQHLLHVAQLNGLKRLFPRMARSKALMFGRVPVSRENNNVKTLHEAVDWRGDRIALRHSQRAPRQKIVLHIYDDKRATALRG